MNDPIEHISLGQLMVEAEELMDALQDPRTWGGRLPRCERGVGVHQWVARIASQVVWTHGTRITATYPVAVHCRLCPWVVGLSFGLDPLEPGQMTDDVMFGRKTNRPFRFEGDTLHGPGGSGSGGAVFGPRREPNPFARRK